MTTLDRFLRLLGNAATAICLAVCLAITAFWILSYWRVEYLYYQPVSGFSPRVVSERGSIQWKLVDYFYPVRATGWGHFSTSYPRFDFGRGDDRWDEGLRHNLILIETGSGKFYYAGIQQFPQRQYTFHYINTPHALLFFLTALPAFPLLRKWFKRGRKVSGNLCRTCGYDLRATPDRCPECGTVTKPAEIP